MKLVLSIIILVLTFIFPYIASSHCSIRTLKNVCEICEEHALEKLQADSIKTQCPEITCPEPSLACVRTDSFDPFLRSSYTLTAMVWQDLPDVIFKLSISKNNIVPNTFNYDVRYENFRMALKDSIGFLVYDIVNFNLPLNDGEKTYSYNCIGNIDNNSFLKGVCSTVISDEEGNGKTYGWSFTAAPSSNPLQ